MQCYFTFDFDFRTRNLFSCIYCIANLFACSYFSTDCLLVFNHLIFEIYIILVVFAVVFLIFRD